MKNIICIWVCWVVCWVSWLSVVESSRKVIPLWFWRSDLKLFEFDFFEEFWKFMSGN